MSKLILSDEWLKKLKEALNLGEYIRRVVIDATVGEALIIHVERYGDSRILEVTPPTEAVIVTYEEANSTEDQGDNLTP